MINLTDEQMREAMAGCDLNAKTPYAIGNVSYSQLSVARYSGGGKYNGDSYTYFQNSDMLVRNDVLKWIGNKARIKKTSKPNETQMEIPT